MAKSVSVQASWRARDDRQTLIKVAVIAAVLVIDATWITASDFTFAPVSAVRAVVIVALLVAAASFYRTRRPLRHFEALCTETALLVAFTTGAAVLSYLVTSLDLPLIDPALTTVDARLGFDWTAYVGFVNARPWLGVMSTAVYVTTLSQVALVLVVLGLINRVEEAQRFTAAVMLGALICIFISGLLPAAGALATVRPPVEFTDANGPLVDLAYKDVFFALREGGERLISLDGMHGEIAFPSYHCTLATLIVLASAAFGWWFWPVLVINVAVVMSTPVDGGHHLSDALAGVAVALIVWAALGAGKRATAPQPQRPVEAAE